METTMIERGRGEVAAVIFIVALGLGAMASAPSPAQDSRFEDWATSFRGRLVQEGVDPAVIAAMMDDLEPDERVMDRDRNQPEFVRPVWRYLASAASDERADNGRAAQVRHAAALDMAADAYGVDRHILTAIWGLESAYGEITGDFDIVRSLATLAWEGGRRAWAESQLLAVAVMIERGYADRDKLVGSWAGAMGQTQFIPTTYLERAVDMHGDGQRDIWDTEADALGSAANLLAQAGWETGAPVVIEARLPKGFDYTGWTDRRRRAVSAWAMGGVRPAAGEWAPDDLYRPARLILPAGARGPAFMAFSNFDAIMRYNNSTAYALGISYLALRLSDQGVMPGGWPEDNPPLNRSESRQLQSQLTALGYDTEGIDGIFGANSRRALKAFQLDHDLIPDGYAGRQVYEAVMARQDSGPDP